MLSENNKYLFIKICTNFSLCSAKQPSSSSGRLVRQGEEAVFKLADVQTINKTISKICASVCNTLCKQLLNVGIACHRRSSSSSIQTSHQTHTLVLFKRKFIYRSRLVQLFSGYTTSERSKSLLLEV